MGDQRFVRIVNWEKFQHYKDRNPPWVKLHRELLTSQTWVSLDDAGRVLAIACMLLAAATDNKIPADPSYIRRVAYLNQLPDLSALLATGFVEFIDSGAASTVLANASALHTNARSETETEEEKEKRKRDACPFVPPTVEEVRTYCDERKNGVDPQLWHDHYLANGWKVGKSAMKDWKAAVRTWEKNGVNGNGMGSTTKGRPSDGHFLGETSEFPPCPFGECDGSGWWHDTATRKTEYCRCSKAVGASA